jgi:hypothetical protein
VIDKLLSRLLGGHELDERFAEHRYRASRMTLFVGLLLMTGWFLYDHYVKDIDHTEILIIIGAMAVTKLAAMAYYRLTD